MFRKEVHKHALKKAKYLAMRMQCTSNVRQQYFAFANYAADNNGRFPEHMESLPYYYRMRTDGKTPFDRLNDTYIEESKIILDDVRLFIYALNASEIASLYSGSFAASVHTTDTCKAYPLGDLNENGKVDLLDFAIIAEQWLK